MTPNMAASVHQRLLNRARAENRPFNELLQRFAMERFLYRLGQSAYRSGFVLKGAMMLSAWQVLSARPTRDIDLEGHMENSIETVASAMRDICRTPAADDGLRFDAESVGGERIVEEAEYGGVRARFVGYLGKARIPMQVDVGFGDPLVPAAIPVLLTPILDFPPASVQGYSRESTIAEKYHAMVHLGQLNSRMKDYYDAWSLVGHFPFDGPIVARAIEATVRRRGTPLEREPVGLSPAFAGDAEKRAQWSAFVRRLGPSVTVPTLGEAVHRALAFLAPPTEALLGGQTFALTWAPGGPWSPMPGEGKGVCR